MMPHRRGRDNCGRDTKLLEEILSNTARRTGAELADQPYVAATLNALGKALGARRNPAAAWSTSADTTKRSRSSSQP